MDRRARLLENIDLTRGAGAEIGALAWPVVKRHQGNIRYVDFAPTAELKRLYADTPDLVAKLVEVDLVWGERPLADMTRERFDYIVASHVIEHVPDPIAWLAELAAVLKPGGILTLAVPDKRFTYDRLRAPSTLADLVAAHLAGARKPMARQLFDHFAGHALEKAEGDRVAVAPKYDLKQALAETRAALADGAYHDIHCHVFTPASFLGLLRDLAVMGLMPFGLRGFHDTAEGEIEFFVQLERGGAGGFAEAAARASGAAPSGGDDENLKATLARVYREKNLLERSRSRLLKQFLRTFVAKSGR